MKKTGFTLSELLVTIGVIAIVAAITAPLLSGLIPDKDKVQVLKIYKTIVSTNQELLDDPSLNWGTDILGEKCTDGFGCLGVPYNPKYSDHQKYGYIYKYPLLFADKLSLTDGPNEGESITFTTADGVEWEIGLGNDGIYLFTVKLNNKGADCTYSAECKKPSNFAFYVEPSGKVYGNDPLTEAFLNNKFKLNDRKKDRAEAKSNVNKQYQKPYEQPSIKLW